MPMFRRRPLLRAAAVGGGAYALGKHSQRAQEEREQATYDQGYQQSMAQAPAPAPAPAAPQSSGITAEDTQRLQELGRLHDQGVLTDEEFAAQKARILGMA
jgi:Short C-terminal domain